MDYSVIYSKRKTIALSIKDGNLVVRAPYFTKKSRIEEIIKKHSPWIEKHIERQREKIQKRENLTEEKINELKAMAKQVLPLKAAYYAKIMGVKYGRITITSAKTRFGSCSAKGNIAFSYRLMTYSDEAIDYVVVHELAHLLELNHSSRFYAIVANVLPDYKARIKLLKN